jgi:hypothetical protein
MIWGFILSGILNILSLIIGLLPTLSSSDYDNISSLTSAVSNIRMFFVNQNFWFPVDDLFRVLSLIIIVEFAVFGFKLTRWIASNLSAQLFR